MTTGQAHLSRTTGTVAMAVTGFGPVTGKTNAGLGRESLSSLAFVACAATSFGVPITKYLDRVVRISRLYTGAEPVDSADLQDFTDSTESRLNRFLL